MTSCLPPAPSDMGSALKGKNRSKGREISPSRVVPFQKRVKTILKNCLSAIMCPGAFTLHPTGKS